MKTSATRMSAMLSVGLTLSLTGPAPAQIVSLQNATATFSQTIFGGQPVAQSIDGNFGNTNGWAVATTTGFNGAASQTAVWEAITDLSTGNFAFTMSFLFATPQHILGRFRLSTTTDDRSLFADGLDSGGDVTANWTVLPNPSVLGPAGMTFTTLGEQNVLAGGTVPNNGVFTVSFATTLAGITGFRLEALEDPSLPGGNGPGFGPFNGNFVLTEFQVNVVPEPGSLVLCGMGVAGFIGNFVRQRRKRNEE